MFYFILFILYIVFLYYNKTPYNFTFLDKSLLLKYKKLNYWKLKTKQNINNKLFWQNYKFYYYNIINDINNLLLVSNNIPLIDFKTIIKKDFNYTHIYYTKNN